MAETEKLEGKEIEMLHECMKYEDQLLISRTGIVLTFNGLMAVAAAMKLPAPAKVVTVMVIIIVNALWLVCSRDANHLIKYYHDRINKSDQAPICVKIRNEYEEQRFRIRSTSFMSLYVPGLLLVGWILGFLLSIFKYLRT